MSSFNPNRFSLATQAIAGRKRWVYDDTGAIGDVADVAGYFAEARKYGVDSGDLIEIHAHNGATNRLVHMASFSPLQDTGATQGSVGPATLVGDTG